MYEIKIEKDLDRILNKLKSRNKILALQVWSKIDEISKNPHHYKPLHAPMQNKRRAHVGHFVIVFEILEKEKTIAFLEFEHHDNAYK